MPNSSYLCCSDYSGIYPCSQDASYDPERNTVACAACCLPMLWLGIFRPADVRSERVDAIQRSDRPQTGLAPPTEAVPIDLRAPVAEKKRALKQLDGAVPILNRLFTKNGSLEEHARLLATAIDDTPGHYVTIELFEVIEPCDRQRWSAFDAVLAYFAAPEDDSSTQSGWFSRLLRRTPEKLKTVRRALSTLTSIDLSRRFPGPITMWESDEFDEQDLFNLSCILGTTLYRPIPWEPNGEGDD